MTTSETGAAEPLERGPDPAKQSWWSRPPGGIFYAAVFAAMLPSWSAVQEPKGYFNRELAIGLAIVLWVPIALVWVVRLLGACSHEGRGGTALRLTRLGWWFAPVIATALVILGTTEAIPRFTAHTDFGDPAVNLQNAEEALDATMRAADLRVGNASVGRERNDCGTGTESDRLSFTADHLDEEELRALLRTITGLWRGLDPLHVDQPPAEPNDIPWVRATLADGTHLVAGQPPDGVFEMSALTDCTRRG